MKTRKSVRKSAPVVTKAINMSEVEARAVLCGLILAVVNTPGKPPKRVMKVLDSVTKQLCAAFGLCFRLEDCDGCGKWVFPVIEKSVKS